MTAHHPTFGAAGMGTKRHRIAYVESDRTARAVCGERLRRFDESVLALAPCLNCERTPADNGQAITPPEPDDNGSNREADQ